jgi:hypothetical protein
VAASDVPALAVGVVGPAEEERGGRVVDEGLRALVQGVGEVLGGDGVPALDPQAERALAHPCELRAGVGQVGLLGRERVGSGCRIGAWERVGDVRHEGPRYARASMGSPEYRGGR